MENINFILTPDQARDICEFYDENMDALDEWEICELVDRIIDEALGGYIYRREVDCE